MLIYPYIPDFCSVPFYTSSYQFFLLLLSNQGMSTVQVQKYFDRSFLVARAVHVISILSATPPLQPTSATDSTDTDTLILLIADTVADSDSI